jgi:hypothetical protein
VAVLSATGCAPARFTRPNYETVYIGQPAYAVADTLGRPHEERGNTWIYRHETPFYMARITFRNNRVIDKKWYYERPISRPRSPGRP